MKLLARWSWLYSEACHIFELEAGKIRQLVSHPSIPPGSVLKLVLAGHVQALVAFQLPRTTSPCSIPIMFYIPHSENYQKDEVIAHSNYKNTVQNSSVKKHVYYTIRVKRILHILYLILKQLTKDEQLIY